MLKVMFGKAVEEAGVSCIRTPFVIDDTLNGTVVAYGVLFTKPGFVNRYRQEVRVDKHTPSYKAKLDQFFNKADKVVFQ